MYQRRFSRRLVAKQKNTTQLNEQLEVDGARKDTKMVEDMGQQDCKGTKQLGVVNKGVCKDNEQLQDIGKQCLKDTQQLEDSFKDTQQLQEKGQRGFKDFYQLEDMGKQGFKDTAQLEEKGRQEIEFCGKLDAEGCEKMEELESSRQLYKRIKCDVDKDTKVNVMKLDENKNVLLPSVAVENILQIPAAVGVKECILVHKPEKCEDNDNNSKASFLKGLFSTDGTSVPMKGVSIGESSNFVEGYCCKSMDNSYNTSIENDLGVKRFKSEEDIKAKRFKSEDIKVVSPEKLEVTGKSNQDIVEIEIVVDAANINSESKKSDLEIGSFTGSEDWRQNFRCVENTNEAYTSVGKNLDTPANGEQGNEALANWEQGDNALANGEHGEDALVNGEQSDEALANWEQGEDALANWEHGDNALANGEHGEGALVNGEPSDEALANWEQGEDALVNGEHDEDAHANGEQGDNTLANWEQDDNALANGEHGEDVLVNGEQGDDVLTNGEQGIDALANREQDHDAFGNREQDSAHANGEQVDDAVANGEQGHDALANAEQGHDALAKGEQDEEDYFENRFCEGFHNAMGMAVVDMQNEKKTSAVSRRNVPRNSQIFGVSELSWRLGTICCDSVHTDVANHVTFHQHEVKKFKCNGCKIKLSDSQLFLEHINNHHSVASSSLKCLENKCRLLFPTEFSLKIHQQECHVEEAERMRMKCNTCSKKEKEGTKDRGEPRGEVFVPHIGEHALNVHRELWI